MRKAVTILVLVAGANVSVAHASEDFSLDVKPVLCIIDRRTPNCDMNFLITWTSATPGYYCLFNQFATTPLRCWYEANAGQHQEQRIVDTGFQYWLAEDGSDEPLVAVAVEVMTTDTGDRRRKRRTRHIWDLL